MRLWKILSGCGMLLICVGGMAQTPALEITVTGKLTRVTAIGGESTGWAIQLDGHTAVNGKAVDSIEVKFTDRKQAEKYVDQRVKVKGTVSYRHGVETGEVAIVEVASIKGLKAAKPTM